ncbi:MAG: sigma-70 family RNA polymerase sigma factor [Acidobacteria bacterium]|nr:sigma-70 family RNA polymerase sigma factor [Acidobacteriota bacterium]
MRDNTSDRQLVERLREGDATAVPELQTTYGTRIYQLAFRYMKNREDAEEVTQDVLLRVFRKIDAFRGDAALSSWIYRITFNAAMSRLRTLKHRQPAEVPHETVFRTDAGDQGAPREVADWSDLADDRLLRSEMRTRLVSALSGLPHIYRAAVLLRDVQGLSTEEASAVLGLKPQTLKSRLHRGRLILRGQLADFADGLAMRSVA